MSRLTLLAFCLCLLLVGCSEEKSEQSTTTGDNQVASNTTTPSNTGHNPASTTPTGHGTPAGHGQTTPMPTTPGHEQHSAPGHSQTTPMPTAPGHEQHSDPGHSQTTPMPMPTAPGHEQHSDPGHSQTTTPMPMPMGETTPMGHTQAPETTPMPGDPAQGQNQIQQFEEGTVERAVQEIVLDLMKGGDLEAAKKYISPEAIGVLADIRDGKLTEEQKTELKTQFAQVQLRNVRKSGVTTTIYLMNAMGDSLVFDARKVDGKYMARNLTIKSNNRRQ